MRNTHYHPGSVEGRVKDIILQHTLQLWKKADLTLNLSFLNDGLGLDSVELVEVIDECEDIFNVHIFSEFLETPRLTIGKLIHFIEKQLEENKPGK